MLKKLAALSLSYSQWTIWDLQTRFQRLSEGASWNDLQIPVEMLNTATRVVEWCDENHASVTSPLQPDYPQAFLRLERPPLFLSYWGKPAWLNHPALSVVGGREPSASALEWIDVHLAPALRASEWVCVSGGARGIDQKSHAASLLARRPTVVVLPSGLGRVYPRDLLRWRESVLELGGSFLSQFAPLAPMWPAHFHTRNRLIAALGDVVLVVEARRKSGSLITARCARDMGQTLAVVPSHPLEVRGHGSLDLLYDGAFPVRDQMDLGLLMAPAECLHPSRALAIP